MPNLKAILRYLKSGQIGLHLKRKFGRRQDVFEAIYKTNYWANPESVSGDGSTLAVTAKIRAGLERVVRQYGIKTMLDAPCGDFHWMKHTNLEGVQYTGGEIVRDLVARHQAEHGRADRKFIHVDIVEDSLQPYDLIFCRDCIMHLPSADVKKALRNFGASGSKYLLITTSPRTSPNTDLARPGAWRPVNLAIAPYGLDKPIELVDDDDAADASQKFMALYKLPLPGY